MISDPRFYALAIPVIVLMGVSKSGFGGAMGGLAVPVLSLVIAPAEAAGIVLPILCAMDIIGARRFLGAFDWRNLRIILPGALAGIAIGTLCFGLLNLRLPQRRAAAARVSVAAAPGKKLFVGTTVMFFLVVNYVKLVPYYFLGQLRATNLATAAVLLPLAPTGIYLGFWLQHRISDAAVYRWANIFLFTTGWKLIWDAVSMLAK
ncbi:MAG: TSUP family transporter [Burkholderiales bacterium]